MTRRLRRCSILLLALPLVGLLPVASAQAAPDPVASAAAWLSTQFANGSHLPAPDGDHFDSKFGSSYFPNYGENADVLFALAAAKVGATKAGVALDYLNAHLADYADTAGAFGGPFDGSVAKVALARIVAGTSADDLLTTLQSDECPAASPTCTPGAPANIFASASDSFVILAEARAGGSFAPSAAAVDYFLSLQCDNGGFTTGTDACGSGDADIDATSYALMALQALGGHATEVAKAADWLIGQRNAAGYWIAQGVPNTNSTGLAAAALAGAGRDVASARAWLLDQRIGAGEPGAGALKYGGEFTPTTTSATSPSVLATAQGVLGLVDGGSLATLTAAGSAAGVNLLDPVATVSGTDDGFTVTAIGFAAGERVDATFDMESFGPLLTATADPSGAVAFTFTVPDGRTSDGGTVTLTGASSGLTARITFGIPGGPPSSGGPGTGGSGGGGDSGPPLANTGTNSTDLTGVGLAALLAGAGILALARGRRRGRHAG